ncbi:hypothetical protein [Streptomyces cucumeris]|uniref:hypothetical protein n=1 Tax=Streptomyces cucumeris TaxID=2962890 RepID=UPI003D759283
MAAFAVPAVTWLVYRATREEKRSQTTADRRSKSEFACEELAAACHAFAHVLKKLPRVDIGARERTVDEAFNGVRTAYHAVTFWSPPAVVAAAETVFSCVAESERRALSAAVVRATLWKLRRQWCPGTEGSCDGNAEVCTDGRHWAAYRASELLGRWGDLDEWEQFEQRVDLEYALSMSDVLSEAELVALRDELNWGVMWDDLTGADTRREQRLREALAAFVEGSRRDLPVE